MAKESAEVSKALEHLDAHLDDFKETLIGLVRIPSVSAEEFPPEEVERSAEAVAEADMVYLSTPILNILELMEKLPALVRPDAFITDAGSTKAVICEKGMALFPGRPGFVGGHPMAGKETTGVDSADADRRDSSQS